MLIGLELLVMPFTRALLIAYERIDAKGTFHMK